MFDPHRHHRRSVRLPDLTYAEPRGYFITVCVQGMACILGEIADADMCLNAYGRIVHEEWHRTATVRPYVELDAFVIMPNHLHGIIGIIGKGSAASDDRSGTPSSRINGAIPERRGMARHASVPTISFLQQNRCLEQTRALSTSCPAPTGHPGSTTRGASFKLTTSTCAFVMHLE